MTYKNTEKQKIYQKQWEIKNREKRNEQKRISYHMKKNRKFKLGSEAIKILKYLRSYKKLSLKEITVLLMPKTSLSKASIELFKGRIGLAIKELLIYDKIYFFEKTSHYCLDIPPHHMDFEMAIPYVEAGLATSYMRKDSDEANKIVEELEVFNLEYVEC